MPAKLCDCGSNLYRRAKHDGYGIFLTFVCDKCEKRKMAQFRPDIMTRYECDEPIDGD